MSTPGPAPVDVVAHIASADEFSALISSNTYVVADFFADWCPPCKAIAPLYTKMATASSVPGRLAFAKINVDHVPAVAQSYGISSMPTFLFFADGRPEPVATLPANGPTPAGPCVHLVDAKVAQIRGADPRALNAVVLALTALAKAAPPVNPDAHAQPKPSLVAGDANTVVVLQNGTPDTL
ncbi:putative thioredoxin-like protein [Phaeoacremonium minimum UCRPA7]|uniref:Putative thioredoxin-like protein n=1 Tax=Phaeoacremonium minimum (strain UCR-PA7) TaxID=1286976 RepID=R8BLC6_PHAM7|nr:putative thioredoxin-like protein [Phaeoacremonium minimum UCRPA7]EOO00159.1 putative thioredoxin-like protein [Phaeoacremonium minimum UCRPA7]